MSNFACNTNHLKDVEQMCHPTRPNASAQEITLDTITKVERRKAMLAFLAMEDARNKRETRLARRHAVKLDMAKFPELRISSYVDDGCGQVPRGVDMLAETLLDHAARDFRAGTKEDLALRSAAAVLKGTAPIGLVRVVFSSESREIGTFILRVGDPVGLPVKFQVMQREVDGRPIWLGWGGDLFSGDSTRTIQEVHADFGRALNTMSKIIKSKGLEACSPYRNRHFVLAHGEVF